MKEADFVLPSPSEKLAYKFILDTLKESQKEEAERITEPTTQVELPPQEIAPEPELEMEEEAEEAPKPQNHSILPPDKNYFRIREVAELLDVEPHVLRYWEGEFSMIRPKKSGSGHRVYSRKDVEWLQQIRHLLHVEKFSIKGAKKKLLARPEKKTESVEPREKTKETLKAILHDLKELVQQVRA